MITRHHPYRRRPYRKRTSLIRGSSLYNDRALRESIGREGRLMRKMRIGMNEAAQSHQNATSLKTALPVGLFTIGAGLILLTLMSDLVGLGTLLGTAGSWRNGAIGTGAAVMILGAALDISYGGRHILAWLKAAASDRTGLLKFLAIGAQLSLLVVIIRVTYMEGSAFYQNVMLLTLYGFVINYFLPASFRLPFFVLLSVGGIIGFFGGADGGWIVIIALLLIAICHLPIPIWARATILSAAGLTLIAMRAGYLPTPWSRAIWPLLGSMFMFRMVIYFYDLRHKRAPVSAAHSL